MALGTVRFLGAGRAPKEGVVNGSLYNFKMFRSQNSKHMRTFYPKFIKIKDSQGDGSGGTEPVEIIITTPGATNTRETGGDQIKIISALVNPEGHDEGWKKCCCLMLHLSHSVLKAGNWLLKTTTVYN